MDGIPSILIRAARTDEIEQLVRIDDDAASLYEAAGLDLSGTALRAFAEAERVRWLSALSRGLGQVALGAGGAPIGFIVLGSLDGQPYLDQISVARRAMRRGVGRALLARAWLWAEAQGALWLTTYAHLPWNAPMYARAGFACVDEAQCGPELRAVLREQRAALPDPDQRVAMVRRAMPSTD